MSSSASGGIRLSGKSSTPAAFKSDPPGPPASSSASPKPVINKRCLEPVQQQRDDIKAKKQKHVVTVIAGGVAIIRQLQEAQSRAAAVKAEASVSQSALSTSETPVALPADSQLWGS